MKKVFAFLLVLIFLISNAFANSSSYYEGDGVTVFPVENKNIVLRKEVVKIKPDRRDKTNLRWLAECVFSFYNKSDSEELVTMGYLDWLNYYFNTVQIDDKSREIYSKYFETNKNNKKIAEEDIFGYANIYFQGYKEGNLPYFKEAWKVHDLKVIVDDDKLRIVHKPIATKIKAEKKFEKAFANGAEESLGAFIWKIKFKSNETKVVKVTFSFRGLSELSMYQELSYLF